MCPPGQQGLCSLAALKTREFADALVGEVGAGDVCSGSAWLELREP